MRKAGMRPTELARRAWLRRLTQNGPSAKNVGRSNGRRVK